MAGVGRVPVNNGAKHEVILVRNQGLSQLSQDNMWQSWHKNRRQSTYREEQQSRIEAQHADDPRLTPLRMRDSDTRLYIKRGGDFARARWQARGNLTRCEARIGWGSLAVSDLRQCGLFCLHAARGSVSISRGVATTLASDECTPSCTKHGGAAMPPGQHKERRCC